MYLSTHCIGHTMTGSREGGGKLCILLGEHSTMKNFRNQ